MTRADFWCRVLGWVQLLGGAALAAAILLLWELVSQLFMIDGLPALAFLIWLAVAIMALPMLLAGLFTVLFANTVEQARSGLRGQQKVVLRVVMALAGLWSAGVIGLAGLSIPPVSLIAILGLMTALIAIMGADWTADLLKPKDATP